MTKEEFSDQFDVLVGAYSIPTTFGDQNKPLEFNEYEKSVFASKAQEEILVSYYSGKNPFGEAFELTEEVKRYLSSQIKTIQCSLQTPNEDGRLMAVSDKSNMFKFPAESNVWYITYEFITLDDTEDDCLDGKRIEVVPTSQDSFRKTDRNPFKGSNRNRALRLDLSNDIVEIIYPKKTGETLNYFIRYVTKPEEIDVTNNTTNEISSLHPALHRVLLEKSVFLAIKSKINLNTNNN